MSTSSPDSTWRPGPSVRPDAPLRTAAEIREIERLAIAEGGLPGAELMDRAGTGAFRALVRCWPGVRRVTVVCGAGNNGGDGFVIARRAREAGFEVRALGVGDPDRLGRDAAAMLDAMRGAGIDLKPFSASALEGVVVDALFGTGLSRPVAGAPAAAIEAMNAAGAPILSVDVPSGIDADTGCVLGVAVRASLTLTFIAPKRGLFTGAGPDHCGRLEHDTLGVPPSLVDRVPGGAARIDYDTLPEHPCLGPRPRGAHKGNHGHVLVVGGELGFAGAVRLAGEAAARVGAGLVSVATREAHAATVSAMRPEIMSRGVEDESGFEALAERATVVVVGPGLGLGSWGERMFASALRHEGGFLVVDADGLNHLAAAGRTPPRREHWVLTPHPGEAARLLGISSREVQADRFAAAAAIRERYGGVCVLKGAGTIVDAGLRHRVGVCVNGNPGMGTGGTGDVLTGVIAGLGAQGASPADAAAFGVCIHGKAGDRAARAGERGLLAGDLVAELRGLVNRG